MGPDSLSRRNFLAVAALAGIGGTVLSACGGDDDNGGGGSGGGGGGNEPANFEWWHIQTTEPGKTLFPELAKAYMAAHANVKIKENPLENEAFKAKMTANIASGKLPDVFQTWGGGVLKQQIDAGLVEDLTEKVASWTGGMIPQTLQPYQFDGKLYAIPYSSGMVGFWYNKELFEKAKIDGPPATWTEYLEAVRKLKAANITPIALAGKEKWPGHYYWTYLALRIGGKDVFAQAASSKDFSAPPFVQAGERLKELVDLQPFQQGFLGAGYPTPGGQAATMGGGKAAMELMGHWAPAVQKDTSKKDLGDKLGFFAFPTVDGGQGANTEIVGGGDAHAVRKGAPEAAIDFLKFLVVDNQQKLVESGAFMPTVKGGEQYLEDERLKQVVSTVGGSTAFQLYLDQAFPPAVGQEINDTTADLIAGKKTPQQVAEAVTKVAKTEQ
jgi:raffinose/stachyose/melibiose transport system substrate-binding protein